MRAIVAWSDRVPERDGVKNCVYDIAFRPDGAQLVEVDGARGVGVGKGEHALDVGLGLLEGGARHDQVVDRRVCPETGPRTRQSSGLSLLVQSWIPGAARRRGCPTSNLRRRARA